ncbi:helix-turn-helix domain-containing protein [Insolitispirillum peregrinum]|nr:helix-turn-helix domain-containing protein [Insolitispirillum peregrinum]
MDRIEPRATYVKSPVLTIALDLGYGSPSAFSALFRRTLGMAPRDYCHAR